MIEVRHSFHEELDELEGQLLEMGLLIGTMMQDAVDAFQQGDVAKAESVIAQDDAVDQMNTDIEGHCMRLLALQQPMARDLRQVVTALKVITDLERIGDHAVDIAKISRKLALTLFVRKPLVDVGPLAFMAQRMVNQSLESLVRRDIALANQVCIDDDLVDDTFKSLREQLFAITQRDPSLTAAASYTLLAVVYIERIADHATNIAERVHYVETGSLEMLARNSRMSARS